MRTGPFRARRWRPKRCDDGGSLHYLLLRLLRPRAKISLRRPKKYWRSSGKFPGRFGGELAHGGASAIRFDARTGQLQRDGSELRLAPRATAVTSNAIEGPLEIVTEQGFIRSRLGQPGD